MFKLKRKASVFAAIAAAATLAVPVSPVFAADDEMMEEVVVTGSRLKRSNAEAPTPMTVLGDAEIDGVGTTNLGELLETLPVLVSSLNCNTD
jgi:iron complex outermembrane recepter protein